MSQIFDLGLSFFLCSLEKKVLENDQKLPVF